MIIIMIIQKLYMTLIIIYLQSKLDYYYYEIPDYAFCKKNKKKMRVGTRYTYCIILFEHN